MSTRTYAVFISYRHADNKAIGRQWASWLHHSLETYEVPPELVGRSNLRQEPVPASLFPVFRDEEELPADADLSVNIRSALERSGLLVVLCSPRAVTSPFVDEEIRYFKELGRSDRILALLIDGEPDARDPALECLPKSLRFGKPRADGTIDWEAPTQPIAADTRPEGRAAEGWTTAAAYEQALEEEDALSRRQIAHLTRDYEKRLELAKLKVIAGALGVDLGELTKRNQSFELAKARKRARVLRAWLAAVGILAIVAAAAGVIALQNQRKAEHQTKVALRELYVNIVRRAAAVVEAVRLGEAREMLLGARVNNRGWEWWYLMARCGPAPMKLTEFAAVDGPAAAALKARLDQGPQLEQGQAETQRGRFGIVLKAESTLGPSGAFWHARRVAGKASIVLNGFQTAMYGTVHGVALGDPDLVSWRHGSGDEMRLRPPKMITEEEIADDNTDYVAFLRDRHIVADIASRPEEEGGFDRQTWPDKEWDVEQQLQLDPAGPESVAIIGLDGARSVYDFRTSTQTGGEPPPPPPQPQWDGPKIQNLDGYSTAVGRGPAGPLVLSSWEFGNVRLRDGRTGQLLGESISGGTELPFTTGNAVAIVPGTEWIAGYFWWKDRLVAGVADLRGQRLLVQFEKAMEAEPDGTHTGGFEVSPDGREAVFSFLTRAGYYFAAWDVKSGKLVYGPLSMGMSEAKETPGQMRPNYAWHPDGSFLALLPRGNVTELRRSFASAPFATLEGVQPGIPTVREIGDPTRLLIGNWVVDRIHWEPVFELPDSALVSADGNRVVLQTRPGVIELVRPGFRRKPANRRETALLHQIRARDASRTGK